MSTYGLNGSLLEIEFDTNRLARCYDDIGVASREWGRVVALRYINRIDDLHSIETFRELYRYRAWHLHPLHGEYAGKFAVNLTGRYRLIVGPGDTENHLVVYEVSNHYDD